ncbi:hypothetical protein [Bdellovibrio sp. BCCA]|uniref:hypothetical protein n=1 Tax=Bdellovibrio sp. BCCA TaxID=3136281 RepID=UPI0030F203C6
MKATNLKKTLIAVIVLATAPYANAAALNNAEISSVRSVLRALNIDESQLTNEDIEVLRNQGGNIRSYEKSKSNLLQKASDGEIYRTCGQGSHGGDGDPV